jgi:hypothetical protein
MLGLKTIENFINEPSYKHYRFILPENNRGDLMRLFRHSKKASLDLSIQSIVILIFAVIMLGLGLGLINFIFSSAKEKLSGSIALTDLSIQPTADKPVTIDTKVTIKMGGSKEAQIGFYNSEAGTVFNVFPIITSCINKKGIPATELPIIAATPKPSFDSGKGEGWKTLVTLPDESGSTRYYVPETFICNLGVYGCKEKDCTVARNADTGQPADQTNFLKATDFTLLVTS